MRTLLAAMGCLSGVFGCTQVDGGWLYEVHGRATDALGRPLEGATISLFTSCDMDCEGTPRSEGVTDAAGNFILERDEGFTFGVTQICFVPIVFTGEPIPEPLTYVLLKVQAADGMATVELEPSLEQQQNVSIGMRIVELGTISFDLPQN